MVRMKIKASGRKLWQKILIPILILLVVVCIYAYKKIEQNKMDAQISTEEKVNNDATTESGCKKRYRYCSRNRR